MISENLQSIQKRAWPTYSNDQLFFNNFSGIRKFTELTVATVSINTEDITLEVHHDIKVPLSHEIIPLVKIDRDDFFFEKNFIFSISAETHLCIPKKMPNIQISFCEN